MVLTLLPCFSSLTFSLAAVKGKVSSCDLEFWPPTYGKYDVIRQYITCRSGGPRLGHGRHAGKILWNLDARFQRYTCGQTSEQTTRQQRQLPGHVTHLIDCDFITRVLYIDASEWDIVDCCLLFSARLLNILFKTVMLWLVRFVMCINKDMNDWLLFS